MPGAPEPFSIPAAFFRRNETGGVRIENENVRSGLIVIDVGVGTDGWRCAVRALLWSSQLHDRARKERAKTAVAYNSLQKSMAFTPRAPSAGPTGGDGVALPAGTTIFCNCLSFVSKRKESARIAHYELRCWCLRHNGRMQVRVAIRISASGLESLGVSKVVQGRGRSKGRGVLSVMSRGESSVPGMLVVASKQ